MAENKNDYEYAVSAAGRVNLIGEHIDYCGGTVLPAALSYNNTVYVRRNGANELRLAWTDLPDRVVLPLDGLSAAKALGHARYPAGSAYMWQQAGHKLVGCDMLLECTVPFGSGLSSSAAIEVSAIAALCTAAGEPIDPVPIARAAQKAEHAFAGVMCGIMDQYASACGRRGCAMLLNCATLHCEYVPAVLGEYEFVIADTKKPHDLVVSKYNERRAETEYALTRLQRDTDIACLADLTPAQFSRFAQALEEPIGRRVRHVVEECERVRRAAHALKTGDLKGLGALFNASHASMRDLCEVTGAEPDALVAAAQSHPACLGSRMTGGGFGGCTVSIVKKTARADFCRKCSFSNGHYFAVKSV